MRLGQMGGQTTWRTSLATLAVLVMGRYWHLGIPREARLRALGIDGRNFEAIALVWGFDGAELS